MDWDLFACLKVETSLNLCRVTCLPSDHSNGQTNSLGNERVFLYVGSQGQAKDIPRPIEYLGSCRSNAEHCFPHYGASSNFSCSSLISRTQMTQIPRNFRRSSQFDIRIDTQNYFFGSSHISHLGVDYLQLHFFHVSLKRFMVSP